MQAFLVSQEQRLKGSNPVSATRLGTGQQDEELNPFEAKKGKMSFDDGARQKRPHTNTKVLSKQQKNPYGSQSQLYESYGSKSNIPGQAKGGPRSNAFAVTGTPLAEQEVAEISQNDDSFKMLYNRSQPDRTVKSGLESEKDDQGPFLKNINDSSKTGSEADEKMLEANFNSYPRESHLSSQKIVSQSAAVETEPGETP